MNCKVIANDIKCSGKQTYGEFCKKHRKHYLLQDNVIKLDVFTCNIKDYTKVELLDYYCKYHMKKTDRKYKLTKEGCFTAIELAYHKHKLYTSDSSVTTITKAQSVIRRYLLKQRIVNQGIGIINRKICNNDEDFYTYVPKDEIEDIYFFSYQDSNKNVWCFDVRSFIIVATFM